MSRLARWLWPIIPLMLSASPAQAQAKKPLQVLIIQSEDSLEQAQSLTAALKEAVPKSKSYSLAPGEFSLEVMTLAMACSDPPDGTCLAQIAAKTKSNQFVWGTMQRDGSKVVVHLRLWKRGETGTEVTARYSASLTDPDDDALAELARTLLSRLAGESAAPSAAETKAETDDPDPSEDDEPTYALTINAGNVDGQLVIDGRAYGKIRNGYAKVKVPAGEHEVVVRASGYHEAIADVTVKSNGRSEVTLHPQKRGDPSRYEDDSKAEESNAGAGWGAIVVGAAMVGGGIYSAVKVSQVNDEPDFKGYRASFQPNQNVCAEADKGTVVPGQASPDRVSDLCTQARTYEALQYILFGLGGVAIGTGVLILLTEPPSSNDEESAQRKARNTAVRAEPRLSVRPGGAEVGLRLDF